MGTYVLSIIIFEIYTYPEAGSLSSQSAHRRAEDKPAVASPLGSIGGGASSVLLLGSELLKPTLSADRSI